MTPGSIEVGPPASLLFRFGKVGGPLALPSDEVLLKSALHRFDDPGRRFRVLYTAESPKGCLLEHIAGFRPGLAELAELAAMPGDDPMPASGKVAFAMLSDRRMASFSIATPPRQRFLDLRELETREHLRRAMFRTLSAMQLEDFDTSDAMGRNRELTQAIAAWAFDHEFNGVVYPSRLDPRSSNWALFEPLSIIPVDERALTHDDSDLLGVARSFGLTISP